MKYRSFLAPLFLALTIFGGASAAQAARPEGHRFCESGMPEMAVFTAQIDKAIDPTRGGDPNGVRVRVGKCMVTPALMVKGILLHNPNASVNGVKLTQVSQLSAYWRKLVPVTGLDRDKTLIWSDCLWDTPSGVQIHQHCSKRKLMDGEQILQDPDTGVYMAATGCLNFGVLIVPPTEVDEGCLTLEFDVRLMGALPSGIAPPPANSVRYGIRGNYFGRHMLPGKCTSLHVPGIPGVMTNLPEECPDYEVNHPIVDDAGRVRLVKVTCSWDEIAARISQRLGYTVTMQNLSFSFWVRADGTAVLTLPREALDGEMTICWELPGGRFKTWGVPRERFDKNGVARITVADVYGPNVR